jgi:hypothetical protein
VLTLTPLPCLSGIIAEVTAVWFLVQKLHLLLMALLLFAFPAGVGHDPLPFSLLSSALNEFLSDLSERFSGS